MTTYEVTLTTEATMLVDATSLEDATQWAYENAVSELDHEGGWDVLDAIESDEPAQYVAYPGSRKLAEAKDRNA